MREFTREECEATARLYRVCLYLDGRAYRQRRNELRQAYSDAHRIVRALLENFYK